MKIFRQIKHGIYNLFYYFPVIWSDRDYSETFLLRIMDKKLRKMSKFQSTQAYAKSSDRKAKDLMIAAELCRRLSGEHRYDEYYRNKHREKWGDIYFDNKSDRLFEYDRALTKYQKRKAHEESLEIHKNAEERKVFEIKYLFKLMTRKIQTWWD